MEAGLIREYMLDIDDHFREFLISSPRYLEEPSINRISISRPFNSLWLLSFNVWTRKLKA
jgi:hypothetical protein